MCAYKLCLDSYFYQAPIYNVVIGECVTLSAVTHFKHNGTEIISWKKDNKLFSNNENERINMNGYV